MNYFEKALSILEKIENLGYEAYIVGGAVRDYILGVELNDIDITCNMPLELIKNNFNVIENGILYDSLTIKDEYDFEITHFRKDLSYENHRHPKVELVSNVFIDLERRDFTMNALIMDKSKKIIDKYNGIEDINNKIIKAIGDPYKRFDEDALRILRALHFSSKLNFKIENNTLDAMINKKNLLSFLSNERIEDYFYKIVYSNYKNGITYINEYDLFEYIPKYKNLLSLINDFKKEDLKVAYFFKFNDYFSNEKDIKKRIDILSYLINNNFNNYSLYKCRNCLINYYDLIKGLGFDYKDIYKRFDELALKDDLAINKNEFAKMFEGKVIKEKIDLVINAILDKKIKNEKEEIINFLKE